MNEVRKRHNEEKITSGQHFCGKCGSLLSSRGSDCVQCNSNSKEQEVKQNRMTHVKGENKSVLPQSSFSFSVKGFPTLLVIGAILGFTTFAIIGMDSGADPYGCTQCDPFLPGYDGPPPIEMEIWVPDDYYYTDGYYDDYYYDDYYYGDYYD